MTMNKTTRRRLRVFASASGIAVLLVFMAVFSASGTVGVVAAENNTSINDTGPYYNDTTKNVSMEAWLNGSQNASLDDIVGMALRIGPVVVGVGPMAPGGIGNAGTFVVALLVIGAAFGAIVGTGVGMVGTVVLAVAVFASIVAAGIAPEWLFAVLLFGLGVLLFRVLQSIFS